MGSSQFQTEYIEYLQDRNTELINKLTQMKENYENKIFSKDLNKHYLISILGDALNVCSTLPQEIDLFFDKMTSAMSILKNVLIKKSEMTQLVEKISNLLNPPENFTTEITTPTMTSITKEQMDSKSVKKGGTVKVSPMINGHVISTEPKIYLNRVPEDFSYRMGRVSRRLSPIIEASPGSPSKTIQHGRHIFRELRVPLQRLQPNKFLHKMVVEMSPKRSINEDKTWKSTPTPKKDRLSVDALMEEENSDEAEDLDGEVGIAQEGNENNLDPLEGPSWLYDTSPKSKSSPLQRPSCYVDYKRRKHRFAAVFDKNEDSSMEEFSAKNEKTLLLTEDKNLSRNSDKNVTAEVANQFDLKECSKKLNEGSEDVIFQSFSDHEQSNMSCSHKRSRISDRKYVEESFDENECVDFANDSLKRETSTPYSKQKITKGGSRSKLNSNTDCRGSPFLRKSENKSPRLSHSNSFNDEISPVESPASDRTPSPAMSPIPEKNKKGKSRSRITNKSVKTQQQNECVVLEDVVVKLEDCMASGQFKNNLSKSRSPDGKVGFGGNSVKEGLRSPSSSHNSEKNRSPDGKMRSGGNSVREGLRSPSSSQNSKNEGRKKRKAAPTNLTEPKLSTKLRRD